MKDRIIKLFSDVQKIRHIVQYTFLILCVWIGIEFYFFVEFLETNGVEGSFYRPAAVDGFLPISSFMNLVYFIKSGEIHTIHPAGFFIFTASILMSLFVGKSFCSWFCPVGLLSEKLADFGQRLFKRSFKIPKILDAILRSLKYLLLIFFSISIFRMTVIDLRLFLDADFNMLSDVRMFYFFAKISLTSICVISILLILSFFFRGFWCRYLCPYGALLGIAGLLSPNKIFRNNETCIHCSKCAEICPSQIKVDTLKTVISDECISCMQCVQICPVENTLKLQTTGIKKKISIKWVVVIILAVYLSVIGYGVILHKWHNNISKEDYLRICKLNLK